MNMLTNEASHEVRDMVGSYALGEAVDGTVPSGYKRTDVGVIPGDWDVLPLGEFARLQRGFDLPHRLRREGDVPVISSSGISGTHDRAMVSAPGVVTGRYGTIGEVFFVTEDYWPLNTTLFVKDFKGNDPLFVSLLLRTIDFSAHSGKSGVPGVNRNDLHQERIVRPTLTDQQAIAAVLSDVDALLAKLDQLITKKSDLKLAAMQQLLTGRVRLPGFTGEWSLKCLGDISEISMGRTPSRLNPLFWGPGSVWLSIADMKCKVLSESKEEITALATEGMSLVQAGTLLMSFKLSIGRLAFAGCDLYTNEAICGFSRLQANAEFLYYALQRTDFSLYGKQAVKGYTLNKQSLKLVEVKLPEPEEQEAIASILSDMDAELAALEARRAKTRELKQGMMQGLLTGRIRLI